MNTPLKGRIRKRENEIDTRASSPSTAIIILQTPSNNEGKGKRITIVSSRIRFLNLLCDGNKKNMNPRKVWKREKMTETREDMKRWYDKAHP